MAEPLPEAAASRPAHTYHCLCSHFLLASARALPALPRRSPDSTDKAYILPLLAPPVSDTADQDPAPSYALLVGTVADRKPQILRREDGLEKRYLQRCGRCRLVVGYQLDWSQYAGAGEVGKGSGRREDVVYLLPGGLVETDEMFAGKDMRREIDLI